MIQDISQRVPAGAQGHVRTKRLYLSRRLRLFGAVLLLLLVIVGIVLWTINARQPDLNDVAVIKTKIGKIYLLPTNEQPALATVTNSKKLSSSFAGKVEDGDKVLIYQNNAKAIVWRPSINKIVDVEPVSIDTPPSQIEGASH